MKTLRLILGDQLNTKHSWFQSADEEVVYLMAEMRQETDYVTHHIQKVVAFFKAMRMFAQSLEEQGHKVHYIKISDKESSENLNILIKKVIAELQAERFEYLLPDEYRLDEQLKELVKELEIPAEACDTEHFYTSREELSLFFEGKKQLLMESFYRMMRKKHQVLMQGEQPLGGQWNFDQQNRKKWKGEPAIPAELNFDKDVSGLAGEIADAGVKTIGELEPEHFPWPVTRDESLSLLDYFCEHLLVHFGDFQDALHTEQKYLFHSRLSFAMNSKLISPREVVEGVESYYLENREAIDISQVEGFIRQILGWREYMRGIYWKEMPEYETFNKLENKNPLPDFFWTGKTKMNCLKHAISQSLETAYAHHIQRLMITGNFALLAQVAPEEVDKWYLGIYIDAIQWVELPNTRGMSQFADGGIVATKPYVSSANYIDKMGNYCSSCHYSKTVKTGEKACPFNALYWNFLDDKKPYLKDNPRMGMMYSLLEKKSAEELSELKERAAAIIANPDRF
ncbi:cryptochrome/photolyase family protein [Robiginitalea sp. IMCC44478]|uniref:cryptochrome/photolyase family protein n=1 Tax=Robiginitalea sp. IMCC44478 TaxID=3459122 RepID=UPI004043436C